MRSAFLLLLLLLPAARVSAGADRQTDRAVACIVNGGGSTPSRLAASATGSAEESAALTMLEPVIRNCLARTELPDSAGFRTALAGRVAERLYRRETRAFISTPVREALERDEAGNVVPPPGSRTVPAGAVPGLLERASRRAAEPQTTYSVAWCTVHQKPQEVDRLVRTEAGSSEERAAFAAVVPGISSCVDAGRQFGADRAAMRVELARALYRYMAGPHSYP